MSVKTLYCFSIFFLTLNQLSAQPGTLDQTFGNGGLIVNPFPTMCGNGSGIVAQPDGKLVVAGYCVIATQYYPYLMRFNLDGSTDTSFGNNGVIIFQVQWGDAYALAVQPDGKILVILKGLFNGLNIEYKIARFTSTGMDDNTFGGGNAIPVEYNISSDDAATEMVLQPDGKIIIAGYSCDSGQCYVALQRYTASGIPDNSFGTNGIVLTGINQFDQATAMALQPDGKIVVTGYSQDSTGQNKDIFILRYQSNGDLDSSFNNDGIITPGINPDDDQINSVLIQLDGKILVTGFTYDSLSLFNALLMRFETNGDPDSTFNGSGMLVYDIGGLSNWSSTVLQQPDGKILTSGGIENLNIDLSISRFSTLGVPDSTFGNVGTSITDVAGSDDAILAAVLLPDYKIVATGSGDNYLFLARFNNDNALGISTFIPEENKVFPNPVLDIVSVESPEKSDAMIYDVAGRLQSIFHLLEGENMISIGFLKPGIYILKVNDRCSRIIKQ